MSKFPIDKGVPIPSQSPIRDDIYPWAEMEIGDSFFVPDMTTGRLSSTRAYAGHKLKRHFASRSVEGGLRVWRTK